MKCEHCNDDFESIQDIIKHLKKEQNRLDRRYTKIENEIESLHKEQAGVEKVICDIEAWIDIYEKRIW